MNRAYLRPGVPLPSGLTPDDFYRAMETLVELTPIKLADQRSLHSLVQRNILSGVISNLFTVTLREVVPSITQPADDTHYPDLEIDGRHPAQDGDAAPTKIPFEIKATTQEWKGGEGHNAHRGWTLLATFMVDEAGKVDFLALCVAHLEGLPADWKYLGSRVKEETGTQRTETYTTTTSGTAKLRDGTLYLDPRMTIGPGLRAARRRVKTVPIPAHSPFWTPEGQEPKRMRKRNEPSAERPASASNVPASTFASSGVAGSSTAASSLAPDDAASSASIAEAPAS